MRDAMALLPLASLALQTLGGCAAEPHPEAYTSLSNDQLCANYAYEGSLINTSDYRGKFESRELRVFARAEIEKRNLVPEADWTAIDDGMVVSNMPKCSVLAAWGTPAFDSITQTLGGTSETMGYSNGNVAILTNGIVTTVTSRH